MTTWLIWLLAASGFGAVAARRPAVAAVLVTSQTLLLGAGALAMAPGRSTEFAIAAGLLMLKAVLVTAIVAVAISRSREARPHGGESGLLNRLGAAVALVLMFVALAFDLVLLIAVAAVFQSRILAAFGTTDTSALRRTRG